MYSYTFDLYSPWISEGKFQPFYFSKKDVPFYQRSAKTSNLTLKIFSLPGCIYLGIIMHVYVGASRSISSLALVGIVAGGDRCAGVAIKRC